MASNQHKNVSITPNDTIIISASPIPGNEKTVSNVVNGLMKLGANVIYEKMYDVHVSGHACQEELKMMLAMINPQYFIPVHGERKQLAKHKKLANDVGIPNKNIMICENGNVIEITKKANENVKMLAEAVKKLMRADRPECQVGGDSWVGYVLGTVGCLKEGYALGYDKDGVHYTYLDRVEWLCRCSLAPYIPELQAEVELLKNSIDENGICRASVDENQLKGIGTYSGQQLETDWKTETKKLCDITFRALLILYYADK